MPGASAFVTAGFVARLAHLATVLGTVFLVLDLTGSYQLGGLVSGAYALLYSLVAPLLSRLADRHRQGPVLMIAAVATAVSRTGFLAAAWIGAPTWMLVLLSAASGASMPAVGALVRARWAHLLNSSPRLHAATSFESVMDEVILVVSPVLVSTLVVYLSPAAGLVLALPLAVGGSVALALARSTEPPLLPTGPRTTGTALTTPGLVLLLLTFVLVSFVIITIELAVVATTERHGVPALTGWILAVLALGSAASGLWYGARNWPAPPHRRLVPALSLLTLGTMPFIVAAQAAWLFVAALVLGVTMAPVLIDGFSTVSRAVPPGQLTEGLTWLTTAAGIGISAGSTVAGMVVDTRGTGMAFIVATGCASVATLTAIAASRRLGAARQLSGPTATSVRSQNPVWVAAGRGGQSAT